MFQLEIFKNEYDLNIIVIMIITNIKQTGGLRLR